MRLAHTAVYVNDLEGMVSFYRRYFAAEAGVGYHNPKTGLQTYFLSFGGGDCRLELMTRPLLGKADSRPLRVGLAHLAFSPGNRAAVDALTAQLAQDGFPIISAPRVTGDGYYESCLLDPEGNQIELVGEDGV